MPRQTVNTYGPPVLAIFAGTGHNEAEEILTTGPVSLPRRGFFMSVCDWFDCMRGHKMRKIEEFMAEQSTRPKRICLPDFFGRSVSLPDGPEAWSCRGKGDAVLLLGLGPGQSEQFPFWNKTSEVYWLESPVIASAVGQARELAGLEPRPPLPINWREVTPDEAVGLARSCRCYVYTPGMRLDPKFWGPLLGRVDAAQSVSMPQPGRAVGPGRPVLLPGNDGQLLHQELRHALGRCGLGPVIDDLPQPLPLTALGGASAAGDAFAANWRDFLRGSKPELLLSVNLRGLDAEGRIFHLCRAMGIPVALWFVDNPWHVLSGVRLPWWQDAHIYVTDAGFVDGLKAQGAERVFHLPLAFAPHMWRDLDRLPTRFDPPLFVGRSAFPEKERFFAAASVPQELEVEAATLLARSTGPQDAPHFFWWHSHLGGSLWPGYDVRRPGLGAERCAQANRTRWLLAGGAGHPRQSGGLRVIGDEGWKTLLPAANIQPPVDYYTALPDCYARAQAVLNVTSLLMPHSLSQRHFDVWASGGLLLSDATQGLNIFADALVEPMRLHGPEDFAVKCAWFQAHPAEALDLRREWREHLRAAHRYEHRILRIMETLG